MIAEVKTYAQFVRSSDFIRQVAGTFGTRISLLALSLATTVVTARVLGPEGRGILAAALALGALGVSLANLGFHTAGTYNVAKDRSLLPSFLGSGLFLGLTLGGAVLLFGAVIFLSSPRLAPINGPMSLLALTWIPVGLLYLFTQNLLLGAGRIKSYNLIEFVTKLLGLGLIFAVLAFDIVSPISVFLTALVALLIGVAWNIWELNRISDARMNISIDLIKRTMSYGLKAYLAALFGFLVFRIDLLIVTYMLGVQPAGLYSVAVSMADALYILPAVIGTILFPKLSAMGSHIERWQAARKTAFMVGLIMLPMTGIAIPLASPVIRTLFGDAFSAATEPFLWLAAAMIFYSVNNIYSNYLASAGLPAFAVWIWAATFVLNVALNLILIPFYGIVGSAVASLIAYAAATVLHLAYYHA